jgi:hypothetical protein
MEYLAIMWFGGMVFGYAVGFFVARGIYRKPTWPHRRS